MAIFVSHLGFRHAVARGEVAEPSFRMPGAPVTDYLCLVALAALAGLMVFDFSNPHWYYTLVAAAVLLGGLVLSYELTPKRRRTRQPAGV